MMPVFLSSSPPEMKAKFDSPDFVETNEEMLKEEFSKYFQVWHLSDRLTLMSINLFPDH